MPINRHAYTKTSTSQCSSEGMLSVSTPSNYGNATTKVINLNNNTWLSDSVVFTVDSAWRYVVHVRNSHNGPSSIHIDDVRVYGKNTATYLLCESDTVGYRYGFGGHQKDDEVKGSGNWYTFGDYGYDPRTGRRWNVDPLASEFPNMSPYAVFNNNPIRFIDSDGNEPQDIIEVDKMTGFVTFTKSNGNDIVRLVSNGVILKSYTYGKNGSFCNENDHQSGEKGTFVKMNNNEKAQKFYELAAHSDVEFGKLDVEKNGDFVSIVTSSHDKDQVGTLPGLVLDLSKKGYKGIKQSHSHPKTNYNSSIPSGHYDYSENSPYSLMPIELNGGVKIYDADNAIKVRAIKGFENTIFEVYSPSENTITTYDGVNKAKIDKK